MFQAIINLLRGYTREINEFESRILIELSRIIPDIARNRLENRIATINRVYRISGGVEIRFYEKKSGNVIFRDECKMSNDIGFRKIARFNVKSKSKLSRVSGVIGLVDGVLTEMVFNRPTEHCEEFDVISIDISLLVPLSFFVQQ